MILFFVNRRGAPVRVNDFEVGVLWDYHFRNGCGLLFATSTACCHLAMITENCMRRRVDRALE